jgi:4-diphosphocytidyl-2-C-methyl-D-erythritol kinase
MTGSRVLPAPLVAFAGAKVNLTLRVHGRRPDGYHELESLVAFADVGDRLTLQSGPALTLEATGPRASAAGPAADNLVLKAAKALAARVDHLTVGHFHLTKRLPAAAGLGGGSADAAAALRLLARANAIAPDDPRLMAAAIATGADVPVCLESQPRIMRGIGENLSARLTLPPLAAVLVNPGVGVATGDVFAALNALPLAGPPHRNDDTAGANSPFDAPLTAEACVVLLANDTNALEAPAIGLQPVVADVLAALRRAPACRLARMSGSGATCFGLFDATESARAAAAELRSAYAHWWVKATTLGAAPDA